MFQTQSFNLVNWFTFVTKCMVYMCKGEAVMLCYQILYVQVRIFFLANRRKKHHCHKVILGGIKLHFHMHSNLLSMQLNEETSFSAQKSEGVVTYSRQVSDLKKYIFAFAQSFYNICTIHSDNEKTMPYYTHPIGLQQSSPFLPSAHLVCCQSQFWSRRVPWWGS